MYGVWFYNNGVPTYITGLHWFVINWWKFQGKYFDFRIPNMEFFYFMDYCICDPNCLGAVEITKRKEGKTARAGAFIYEYISRNSAKHGGIQSKTDGDAEEVLQKAIVTPWRKLPGFFRPLYDTAAGDNPKKELRFFNPSIKSRKGRSPIREEALESFIDFESSGVLAYDGPELARYVSDESGKLKSVSIVERHGVVQFCSEVDGVFIGKHLYTTTVEEMESGGSEFQTLVKMSNRNERDDNGRTKSGLYCYFLPAYRTLYYDKYGFPDEIKGKQYYVNRRAAMARQPRELSSFIRKNPFTLAEAFRVDGEKCLYDSEKLNNRLDFLSWRENLTERGNFRWREGKPLTSVIWEANVHGKYEICFKLPESEANRVEKRTEYYYPSNTHVYAAGADPFKYDKVKDNRRSDCAAFVGLKPDVNSSYPDYSGGFICRYLYRAATTSEQYEDLLKMCWYYGCQILFESNVDNWKEYFKNKNCHNFLMKLPGQDDYGMYSDGHGKTIQQLCDYTEAHIDNDIDKVWYASLIEEWLEFKVEDTTRYDQAIAAGFTLIAMKKKFYRRDTEKDGFEVTNFVRSYVAV